MTDWSPSLLFLFRLNRLHGIHPRSHLKNLVPSIRQALVVNEFLDHGPFLAINRIYLHEYIHHPVSLVFLQQTGILYPKVDVAVNRQHEDQADENVRVRVRILPSRVIFTPGEPPFEPPLEQLPVGHPETLQGLLCNRDQRFQGRVQ